MANKKDPFVEEDENVHEESSEEVTTQEKPAQKTSKEEVQKEKEQSKIQQNDDPSSSDKFYHVELPSEGKLGYPHTIEHRDVLWKDQKILSTTSEQTFTKTLNKTVKSIVNNPDWYEEMTITDRDFLLVWIFANNFSTSKSVEITCSECGNVDTKTLYITDLEVNNLSGEYIEPFRLPLQDGNEIYLRLARVKDELNADEFMRKSDNKDINENLETLILYQTIDVGYELPMKAKIRWIENHLTAKDMALIRQFHEYFSYGINDIVEHECSNCGEINYGRFPFRLEELFTPSVQNDFENILQANKGA